MRSIGITGVAYALPQTVLTLAELADRGLLESPPSVLEAFGFSRAYVSDRPGDRLAQAALEQLIAEQDLDPESVDALFYAGAIPGSHQVCAAGSSLDGFNYPAARLQYECGMTRAVAVGVGQAGCTGLMTAISLAADRLRADPGAARIVCVSADVLPSGTRREIIYNVISDGACAVLVERDAARNRILAYRQITKGYYWDANASRNEIIAAYFPTARIVVSDTLQSIGMGAADVALVVPHNVSLRSWQILLPIIGIPMDRLFAENIAGKGHLIAADNFINLRDAANAGRIQAGDRVLLFTFGFGANWAAMLLEG
jgi:3-oxoacyl-[acyl-carrier-protein] synthase-3